MEQLQTIFKNMYRLNAEIRIIGMILLVIIWVLYIKNKRSPFEKGYYFFLTLIMLSVNIVFEWLSMYNLYHRSTTIILPHDICHRLFFVTICCCVYLLYLHVISICGEYTRENIVINIIRVLPVTAGIISGFVSNINFHFNLDGAYTYGPILNVTYAVIIIYFIMSMICIFVNRAKLGKKNIRNLLMGFIVWFMFVFAQMIQPTMLLSDIGLVVLMLMNYLTFEDATVYINYENACFNSHAYRKMLRREYESERDFYVCQISFHEFQIVHGQYGHDMCQLILKDIAGIVERIMGCDVYSVEEEIIGIILSEKEYSDDKIRQLGNNIEYDYTIHENLIHITGNISIIKCPEEARSIMELEDTFDFIEKYKDRSKNFYTIDKHIYKEKKRYATILRILENAINNDGFYIVYQPIYSVEDKNFHSAEALIRLKDDKTIGFISPDEFITIAEKEGMIMKIGDIVLNKVCSFAKENNFIQRGIKYIEINLSAIQCIDRGLVNQITNVLNKYGLPFDFLNLEITETAATSSGNMLTNNVSELRNLGVTFSMDDFGTGYSNIAQMVDVPYEIIKLDKSLIWGCYPEHSRIIYKEMKSAESIEKSMAVLTKVIELISDLKLKIVAEGIETEEMAATLAAKGVHYLQGYYYSKPIKGDEFVKLLDTYKEQ